MLLFARARVEYMLLFFRLAPSDPDIGGRVPAGQRRRGAHVRKSTTACWMTLLSSDQADQGLVWCGR